MAVLAGVGETWLPQVARFSCTRVRACRTVVVSESDELAIACAELGVTHLKTGGDPFDVIEAYRPQVAMSCHDPAVRRSTRPAVDRTGIPAKQQVVREAFAVQERYFRDLDRTNTPQPETDLFAGL